jgi:hypothetical protein
MSVNIDLKPLSEEIIKQMGYSESNLWLIKIGSVVFGPFETQTLKHYLKDNEHLFEKAEASQVNDGKWKPFWNYTEFERRKLQVITRVNSEHYDGPFWIIESGLKTGTFTFKEIDKKIEIGLIGMTDHISIDNGNNWIKVYQIKEFDRRMRTPEELPEVPIESTFYSCENNSDKKNKPDHQRTITELADLTWQGIQEERTAKFNLEEMNWKKDHSKFNILMKWAVPSFILTSLGFGITSLILFSSLNDKTEVANNDFESKTSAILTETNRSKKAHQVIKGSEKDLLIMPSPSSSINAIPGQNSEVGSDLNATNQNNLSQGDLAQRNPASLQQMPHMPDSNSMAPQIPPQFNSFPGKNSGAVPYGQPMYQGNSMPMSPAPKLPPIPSSQSKYPTQVISHNDNVEAPAEEMGDSQDRPDNIDSSIVNQEDGSDIPKDVDLQPPLPEILEESSDY